MTVAEHVALARAFDAVRVLMLDFDGPVCDVYAGGSAAAVASDLRDVLAQAGAGPLPADMLVTEDPLHLVRRIADLAPGLTFIVDDALRAAEVQAMHTASPTPGAAPLLQACERSGVRVAVVSNNSAEAVFAYLDRHDLSSAVHHVEGRAADPRRMKPDPAPLRRTLSALGEPCGAAVLVGDSETDLTAARAAYVRVVGYANKPGKERRLASADAVIDDIAVLVPFVVARTRRDRPL